jgi:SRSO17 transposase
VKYDYYLSNALDESVEEFVRVIVGSHRVEDCFRRAKGACGLADYEVQTWYGWHHHVTISLLACWFLTKETTLNCGAAS